MMVFLSISDYCVVQQLIYIYYSPSSIPLYKFTFNYQNLTMKYSLKLNLNISLKESKLYETMQKEVTYNHHPYRSKT